jgi:hypothetical protein
MVVPIVDSTGELLRYEANGAFNYARFDVVDVAIWPGGGGRIRLSIKWSTEIALIPESLDTISFEFDIDNLNVCRARLTGIDAAGDPLDIDYPFAKDSRGLTPFCWPFGGASLPREMLPVVPLFEGTTTRGTYAIVNKDEADPPIYTQLVTLKPDGVISIQEDGLVCPLGTDRLEFRPGMPWFDRRAAAGTLSMEVVEVGGGS